MPFSFEWILTIPGMLISCGVVLLIIAFIMFLIGFNEPKKKKEKDIKVNDQEKNDEQSVIDSPITIDFETGKIDEDDNFVKVIDEKVNASEVTEINEVDEPVKPIEVINPEVVEINLEKSDEQDITKTDVIEPEVIDKALDNKADVIDVSTIKIKEPVQHQIYGGADPLDATRELPKVDVRHVPYSGGREELKESDIRNVENKNKVPEVERIPDDFAFKPVIEENQPVEVKNEEKKDFDIKPMVDDELYKFSTNVVEIPDDIEEI